MPDVITNGHTRPTLLWHALPESERAWFDYDTDRDHDYVKYRGAWYDLGEFMMVDSRQQPYLHTHGWQGYCTDTCFSAIVVKYDADDSDRVIMGTVYST